MTWPAWDQYQVMGEEVLRELPQLTARSTGILIAWGSKFDPALWLGGGNRALEYLPGTELVRDVLRNATQVELSFT